MFPVDPRCFIVSNGQEWLIHQTAHGLHHNKGAVTFFGMHERFKPSVYLVVLRLTFNIGNNYYRSRISCNREESAQQQECLIFFSPGLFLLYCFSYKASIDTQNFECVNGLIYL